jgi:hypothetical protein
MPSKSKIARTLIVAMGIAIVLPPAMTITARLAHTSGYSITSGEHGEPQCDPGGPDDCPI